MHNPPFVAVILVAATVTVIGEETGGTMRSRATRQQCAKDSRSVSNRHFGRGMSRG